MYHVHGRASGPGACGGQQPPLPQPSASAAERSHARLHAHHHRHLAGRHWLPRRHGRADLPPVRGANGGVDPLEQDLGHGSHTVHSADALQRCGPDGRGVLCVNCRVHDLPQRLLLLNHSMSTGCWAAPTCTSLAGCKVPLSLPGARVGVPVSTSGGRVQLRRVRGPLCACSRRLASVVQAVVVLVARWRSHLQHDCLAELPVLLL
mmetsp:Transcript_9665/g.28523  ORF Transcript_9665/g.28523 Transcript_9665/m.28523 type:complete len:206 (-) Transcript_9665:135-752(-)